MGISSKPICIKTLRISVFTSCHSEMKSISFHGLVERMEMSTRAGNAACVGQVQGLEGR